MQRHRVVCWRACSCPDNTQQVQAEGRRNKMPLEKGFSQVSWLKLTKSGADLTGVGRAVGHLGSSALRDALCMCAVQHPTGCHAAVCQPCATNPGLTAWLAGCLPAVCWAAAGGAGRRRDITLEEVRQHRTEEDAWMVLHGKVGVHGRTASAYWFGLV